MSVVKYKKYIELMLEQNSEVFAQFREVHDGYQNDPERWTEQFHQDGKRILDIARDWERRLCFGTEKGKYAHYSAKLSEKFWKELEINWPLINQIGIKKKTK